jgi:hypothetical protein
MKLHMLLFLLLSELSFIMLGQPALAGRLSSIAPEYSGKVLPVMVDGDYTNMCVWVQNSHSSIGVAPNYWWGDSAIMVDGLSVDGRLRILRASHPEILDAMREWAFSKRSKIQEISQVYENEFSRWFRIPPYNSSEVARPVLFFSITPYQSLLVFFESATNTDPQETIVDTSEFISLQLNSAEYLLADSQLHGCYLWNASIRYNSSCIPIFLSKPYITQRNNKDERYFDPGECGWERITDETRKDFLELLDEYIHRDAANNSYPKHSFWSDNATGDRMIEELYETPYDFGLWAWSTHLEMDKVEHNQLTAGSVMEILNQWDPLHVCFFKLSNGSYQLLFFKSGGIKSE